MCSDLARCECGLALGVSLVAAVIGTRKSQYDATVMSSSGSYMVWGITQVLIAAIVFPRGVPLPPRMTDRAQKTLAPLPFPRLSHPPHRCR